MAIKGTLPCRLPNHGRATARKQRKIATPYRVELEIEAENGKYYRRRVWLAEPPYDGMMLSIVDALDYCVERTWYEHREGLWIAILRYGPQTRLGIPGYEEYTTIDELMLSEFFLPE